MFIESLMPSNHLILYCPLLLLPSIFPSIRVFSNESSLCIRWPKYWSFNFSISPSNEYSGLISFRIDWPDLLAVQGTHYILLYYILIIYYYIDLDLLVFIFFWLSITFWTNTDLISCLSLLFFIFWNKASLVTQLVKNLPAMQKTWAWSLGQEDPLEKEMATHSSTLTWRTPWTEELGRLQFMGRTESDMTVQLSLS